MTDRLSVEREAEIRQMATPLGASWQGALRNKRPETLTSNLRHLLNIVDERSAAVRDLLAEVDALRAEFGQWGKQFKVGDEVSVESANGVIGGYVVEVVGNGDYYVDIGHGVDIFYQDQLRSIATKSTGRAADTKFEEGS